MIIDWRDSLFDEKTIWSLYKKARSVGKTRFNNVISSFVSIIIIVFILLNEFILRDRMVTLNSIVDNIRALSGDGISFSTQLLGFLVAGFTIFATVTKPDVFRRLARTKYEDSNALKYIFYCFMIVFIHYVCFLFFCVILKVLLSRNAPGAAILSLIPNDSWIRSVIIYISLLVIANWFIFLTLVLKSFLWNVYTSVLLVIAAGSSDDEP